MHPEAYSGFGWAAGAAGLDLTQPLTVLDVGGQDVNGTVHTQFTHPDTTITTLDIENADVIADARTWQPDRLFDVVVATEVFEHVEDWPAILRTMGNALNPDGAGVLLATCASTNRPPHGATGAPLPAVGEWYRNVDPGPLEQALQQRFPYSGVRYQYPPGDAYMWASIHPVIRPTADVTVIIPTVAPRAAMLQRALYSVDCQTLRPRTVIVEPDTNREGPAVVRNRALAKVKTEWVAFLDDDDVMLPHHLHTLWTAQQTTNADLVWPWFTVEGGSDPFPQHQGRQWNPADPHQIPITVLARTKALRTVGGFTPVGEDAGTDRLGHRMGEDWRLWLALSAAGYKFHHVDQTTWVWVHHHGRDGGNSSGLPSRVKW